MRAIEEIWCVFHDQCVRTRAYAQIVSIKWITHITLTSIADIDALLKWKHSDKFYSECLMAVLSTIFLFSRRRFAFTRNEYKLILKVGREKNRKKRKNIYAQMWTCLPRKCGPILFFSSFIVVNLPDRLWTLLLLLPLKLIMVLNFNCVKEEHL